MPYISETLIKILKQTLSNRGPLYYRLANDIDVGEL
jgi:hypothetical protein